MAAVLTAACSSAGSAASSCSLLAWQGTHLSPTARTGPGPKDLAQGNQVSAGGVGGPMEEALGCFRCGQAVVGAVSLDSCIGLVCVCVWVCWGWQQHWQVCEKGWQPRSAGCGEHKKLMECLRWWLPGVLAQRHRRMLRPGWSSGVAVHPIGASALCAGSSRRALLGPCMEMMMPGPVWRMDCMAL